MSVERQPSRVAIITGGASGLGFGVAETLVKQGGWDLHIIDINARADEAVKSLGHSATFHRADVTSFESLSTIFKKIFDKNPRIDFVFANAGVVEKGDFYHDHDLKAGLPPLDYTPININLIAVVNTAYIALNYFRHSPKEIQKDFIATASIGSLYPAISIPQYTASKHGVLGFVRSIAPRFQREGIRANAILPGAVRTNLINQSEWALYPQDSFTSVHFIAQKVAEVLSGYDMTDSWGKTVQGRDCYGLAIEMNMTNMYFRDQPEWCDEHMEKVMSTTEHELHGS